MKRYELFQGVYIHTPFCCKNAVIAIFPRMRVLAQTCGSDTSQPCAGRLPADATPLMQQAKSVTLPMLRGLMKIRTCLRSGMQ